MRKTLALLTILLSCIYTQAQNANPKGPLAPTTFSHWSLSLEAGPVFPVGAFHHNDPYSTTSNAGNARTGVGADLSATYRFAPSFGLTILGGIAEAPEHNELLTLLTPGWPVTLMVQNKHWKMARFLVGPTFEQPFTRKGRLSLQIRALAGLLKTRVPDFTEYAGTQPTDAGAVNYLNGPLPWAFAYQADAGLKWKLTRYAEVIVNAGYMGSRHTASYSQELMKQSGGGAYEPTQQVSQSIDIGMIQFHAGVEVSL
jgi:hypothetical protein